MNFHLSGLYNTDSPNLFSYGSIRVYSLVENDTAGKNLRPNHAAKTEVPSIHLRCTNLVSHVLVGCLINLRNLFTECCVSKSSVIAEDFLSLDKANRRQRRSPSTFSILKSLHSVFTYLVHTSSRVTEYFGVFQM